MKRESLRSRASSILLAGAAALVFTQAEAQTVPTSTIVHGNSFSEWAGRWVQWLDSIPARVNPQFDTTGANCAQKQSGPVWFLAGLFAPGSVTRSCTIPAGKDLFFPILSSNFGAAQGDCKPSTRPNNVECNIADLRAAAAAPINPVTLTASVDGAALPNLLQQRVQSAVTIITLPADNILNALNGKNLLPAGTYAPNVSDGYWLLVPALSAGPHTVNFKGVIGAPSPWAGTYEVTYNLTVLP